MIDATTTSKDISNVDQIIRFIQKKSVYSARHEKLLREFVDIFLMEGIHI